MSLRVFRAIRTPRRSAPVPQPLFWQLRTDHSASETDDLAWFTESAEGGGSELAAEPPRLDWRAPAPAPAPAEVIRWRPLL